MSRIRISSFAGMIPRISGRHLQENQAQSAVNCRLTSGALQSWRDKKQVATLAKTTRINSLYLHGNGTAAERWLHWNEDVDVVRGKVAGDATERTYFTGTDAPRVTNAAMVDAGGNDQYPEDSYILGIPPSGVAPTVALAGVGSGPTYSRAYVYTLIGEFGEEGAPSPVSATLAWQSGNTVNLTNIGKVVTLTRSGSTVTATSATHGYATADRILHAGANEKAYNGVHAITVVDPNTYTYTITETPATPATGTIECLKVAATTTIGKRNITKKRIYRLATSVTGAAYRFVADINAGVLTYADSIADASLGSDVLPSAIWSEPPAGLKGIIALPNGVMAGFNGNELYLTPAYIPYAWPSAYKQTINGIVALSFIGNTIIVLTNTIPYLVNAQDPAQVSIYSRENDPYPCVSKRSVVRTENGILYASNYGIVSGSTAGFRKITDAFLTKTEWEAYYPSTIHAYFYGGRYVGFYTKGLVGGLEDGAGFVFDPNNPVATWTKLDQYAYGGFQDEQAGDLYLSFWDGSVNYVYQWNAEGTNLSYTWKSKLFQDKHPNCFQAARLHFLRTMTEAEQAAYDAQRAAQIAINVARMASLNTLRGPLGATELGAVDVPLAYVNFVYVLPASVQSEGVTLKYYANGDLKHQETIFNNTPFRMPGGYTAYESELELVGKAVVTEAELATTMSELTR